MLAYYQETAENAQKYFQIIEPFNSDDTVFKSQTDGEALDVTLGVKQEGSDLVLSGVSGFNKKTGAEIIDISMELKQSDVVYVSGDNSDELDMLAKVVIGLQPIAKGQVLFNGHDISKLNTTSQSSHIGYLDSDSHVFGITIDENIALGLKHFPMNVDVEKQPELALWVNNARMTGNFDVHPDFDWLSKEDKTALAPEAKLDLYELLGVGRAMFIRGLNAGFYAGNHGELEKMVNETRSAIRKGIKEAGLSEMVYPFDANEFNPYASLDENIIFEYINGFYNPRRRHSALGWKSPLAFVRRAA